MMTGEYKLGRGESARRVESDGNRCEEWEQVEKQEGEDTREWSVPAGAIRAG